MTTMLPPPYEVGSNWNQNMTAASVISMARSMAQVSFGSGFTEYLKVMDLLGRTAITAQAAADAAGVGAVADESGTTMTTLLFGTTTQELGSQWYVSGLARIVDGQIQIPDQATNGTFVSEVVYKGGKLQSADVLAKMVLGAGGSTNLDTGLYIRCNQDATSFVYANVFQGKLYFGHGTRTLGGLVRNYNDWLNLDISWSVGESLGIRAEGNQYTVYKGDAVIAEYTDTANEASAGPQNRYVGGRVEHSRSPLRYSFNIAALSFAALNDGTSDYDVDSNNAVQRAIKSGEQGVTAQTFLKWYTTAGIQTYTIPGDGYLDVAACGGGGGGKAGDWFWGRGDGGKASSWAKATWTLSGNTGNTVTITTGAAGAGTSGNGGNGGNSSVAMTGKTTVSATGGAGGSVVNMYGNVSGADCAASSISGVTLPGAFGGADPTTNDSGIAHPGGSPGAGGSGAGASGLGNNYNGGPGGSGRCMVQYRTGAPGTAWDQITGWASDDVYPAVISSDKFVVDVVGSGGNTFNINVRARISVTEVGAQPRIQLRKNGTPIGDIEFDATAGLQDRTIPLYDVVLADGDELTLWQSNISGTIKVQNTDITVIPTS